MLFIFICLYKLFTINSYILLSQKEKGFNKKGGLFSEFTDQNKYYIRMKNLVNNTENNNDDQKEIPPKIENTRTLPNGIKIKKKFKKETMSPILDKAKSIIEDKGLAKLKYYLVKTGALKNKS